MDDCSVSNSLRISSSESESDSDEWSVDSLVNKNDKVNKTDPFILNDEQTYSALKWRQRHKRLQSSPRAATHEQAYMQRLPTRKPDLNTSNRNALLARENRKKKKEYLNNLEEELQEYKRENRTLRKMLKRQLMAVKRLSHEKEYFKNVLANESQIVSLVHNIRKVSRTPRNLPTPNSETIDYKYPEHFDEHYTGGDSSDFFTSTYDFARLSPQSSHLENDHSYSEKTQSTGVCLHVNGDRVSLEFCPSCNEDASKNIYLL